MSTGTTPKLVFRIGALAVALLFAVGIVRDMVHDPSSRFVYLYLLAITVAFVVASTWHLPRDWIASHLRVVRMMGGCIVVASFAWLALTVSLSAQGHLSAKAGAWAFCASFYLGGMTIGLATFISQRNVGKGSGKKV
jgi:hypothetical protein